MAYTPKTWQCGETVTDAKMNNIEQGIQEALACCGGGGMGCDLVIRKVSNEDAVVIYGDFDAVYNKVLNRELVVGYFINSYNYNDAVINEIYPLLYITNTGANHSLSMNFNRVYNISTSMFMCQYSVVWDATGIQSVNYTQAKINGNPF